MNEQVKKKEMDSGILDDVNESKPKILPGERKKE